MAGGSTALQGPRDCSRSRRRSSATPLKTSVDARPITPPSYRQFGLVTGNILAFERVDERARLRNRQKRRVAIMALMKQPSKQVLVAEASNRFILRDRTSECQSNPRVPAGELSSGTR